METLLATPKLKQQRWQQCQACPHLKNKLLHLWIFKPLARCGMCGCFLKAKIALKPMKCPLGKW